MVKSYLNKSKRSMLIAELLVNHNKSLSAVKKIKIFL